MTLSEVTLPVQIRLRSIEVLLNAYGYVNRDTLAKLHGLQIAAIAKDLALYRTLNNGSCYYNSATRRIEKLSNFKPIFN